MTGINHILAGGIIGVAIASPVAIPVAFVSHFVLDALPHYGIAEDMERSKDWVWKIDVVLVSIFIVSMISTGFDAKTWALIGAAAAASPDVAWVYRFIVNERFGTIKPKKAKNKFNEFHVAIQKHESPDRLWIEAVSLAVLTTVFVGIAF